MSSPVRGISGKTGGNAAPPQVPGVEPPRARSASPDNATAVPAPAAPAPASVPAAPPLPAPGERIGSYELIRELGRGGMGAVYVARDTKLGRRVAIKFLQSGTPELTARFLIEARATARCHHENIVVIHDVGEHRGDPYIVLEYLQGTPLTKLMEVGQRLPAARVVELMVPVARALVCAHERDIIHRDLKPDNIFITDSGTVKVLDFGLAKLVRPGDTEGAPVMSLQAEAEAERAHARSASDTGPLAAGLTGRGAIMGTMSYMAPEQWSAGDIDHRADLWAVGIILFELVAGRHPLSRFQGWSLGMTVSTLDDPMPSVRPTCPDLPDQLADAIDRCLFKPREQRMPSARALLEALEPLLPGRHRHSLRADECPYPGLAGFQEADAGRFFGRSRDITAAVARLRDQPLLGIIGPSGAGKSSFVRAGIVPVIKQSGEDWSALIIRPGRQPLDTLAHLLAPMLQPATELAPEPADGHARAPATSASAGATMLDGLVDHRLLRARLHAEPGLLGAVLRARARQRGQNIVLFVDQLEELYTLVDDERERLAFTACLASVADDATTPLRVITAIRADFLDRVAEDPHFVSELSRALYFLRPPDRAGLRDALVQPADLAGYRFEDPAMVDHMLDHLERTPGALPLLQFAAARLWDLRDPSRRMLTADGYQAIGRIEGALASHADAVITALSPPAQTLARALFLRLVTADRTRAIVAVDELHDLTPRRAELGRLVEHLVNARLLVIQTGDGASTIELVHESLIHTWPLLARWIEEGLEDTLLLTELRQAARQWDARGRHHDLLWRGEPLAAARHRASRFRRALSPLEHAFLDASSREVARTARTRHLAVGSIITLLSLLLAAAAVALVLIRAAQGEAVEQAAAARRAEAAARAERERAVAAGAELARANQHLERNNAALVEAVEAAERARREAEAARARAEQARGEARRDRRRAVSKEREARAAETRARDASTRLQALLAEERERVRRLESQGGTMVQDIEPLIPAGVAPRPAHLDEESSE